MDEAADAGNGLNRSRRRGSNLPRIGVHSRADMRDLLDKFRRHLIRRAEQQLGPTPEAEQAVRTTRMNCLAVENPDFDHGLAYVFQVLRNQCVSLARQRARKAAEARRREEAGGPVDPVIRRPLVEVIEAVEELPPAERQVLLMAFDGYHPSDIASLLDKNLKTVYTLLYRARRTVRNKTGGGASGAGLGALLLGRGTILHRTSAPPGRGVAGRLANSTAAVARGMASRLNYLGSLAGDPLAQTATVAALVVLCTAWTPSPSPSSDLPGNPTPPAPTTQTPTRPTSSQPVNPDPAPAVLAQLTHAVTPKLPVSIHVTLGGAKGAQAETPEDVRVSTAATPPRAPGAGPPAIVAIGMGQTCQCQVLLQSLDGGVTWTAADGPLVVLNQLVLPPTYPADPRIFGSSGESSLPPYEAASFGAPFQSLALPGGQVAVAADFDIGDPRVFVAGQTGVWSLDLASSTPPATPHLEVGYASESGAVAALATPPAEPSGPAVLVWAPNLAVVPGSLTPPHLSPTLMACPTSGFCTPRGDIPTLPQFLTVGADAARTVVAYAWSSSSVFVSRNGGWSFSAVALPSAGELAYSFAVMGAAGQVWGSFGRGMGGGEVARLGDDGAWVDAGRGDPLMRSQPGSLVAVDSHRIVDALPGAGYRCTTTDGAAWTGRCPRA